ncbi:hypothetical protein PS893_00246 [Pseudomonas fluorescens]|uniref:hypothetical protein n=1 Tax=Pseudomonas fluorescens TaxID=294 RepID=UPI001256B7DD|nr:hypothetical protein [Pseudomonas fluorescens]VVO50179.1 hypothetical protein PS893_00246 [Pseudomonas fluorescens]
MSGKFLSGAGALFLVVFGVALEKYWDTPFIKGIAQGILNLPDVLVAPVGVSLWLVIVVVLAVVIMVLGVSWALVHRKFEREVSHAEPVYKSVSIELPPLVSSDQKKILSFLGFVEDNESMASLRNLAKTVRLSKLKCDYALQQLQKSDLVLIYKGSDYESEIMLTPKGKEFIVTNSISTEWHAWLGIV